MLAFVTNDLHLMKGRYGFNQVLLDKIEDAIEESKPDIVLIPGDIFHTKDATYETVKEQFGNFLKRVSSRPNIKTIYVGIGNHDWCIEHSLHALHHFEDKAIYPKVVIVASSVMITDKIGMMGYARTLERFEENLASLDCDNMKVMFGHFALNEFELGTGYEEIDLWCDASIFQKLKKLTKIVSGHWHKYQVKKMSGIEITYLGSPATVDRGESNQTKYFGLFDTDTFELKLVETGLTMHKSYKVDIGDELPVIPEGEVSMGVEHVVCVRGTPEQLAGFREPKGYLGLITYDAIQPDSKRETIDAFSGAVGVVKAYMSKKAPGLKEMLLQKYGPERMSDIQLEETVEKFESFGRRLALNSGK